MFLEALTRRNRPLITAAVALHQAGAIPAASYVLDVDSMEANARAIAVEGKRLGLDVFAMTKQFGRNPVAMEAVQRGGIERSVAVDMGCARPLHAAGTPIGHLGHLVQVPVAETDAAASMTPDYWTVYCEEKAAAAAAASANRGREQRILARMVGPGDTYYRNQEGGFDASQILQVADRIDALDGARFAGITTFPALLFDSLSGSVRPTPNCGTLERAAARLRDSGRTNVAVNLPGTTSTAVLAMLADLGATQVEPGHALTGTTPLHAVRDLVEVPAALYLTEVSHHHAGEAFCFGGGLYVDPVFPDYATQALALRGPSIRSARRLHAEIPPPSMIDYHAMLTSPDGRLPAVGETIIFGYRIQAFVTRAFVVPVRGIASGSPEVAGIFGPDGRPAAWPL